MELEARVLRTPVPSWAERLSSATAGTTRWISNCGATRYDRFTAAAAWATYPPPCRSR